MPPLCVCDVTGRRRTRVRLSGGGRGYFAPRRRRPQGDGEKIFPLQLSPPATGSVLPPLPRLPGDQPAPAASAKTFRRGWPGRFFIIDLSSRSAVRAFHGGREILSPKTVFFHLLIFPKGLFCHFFDRLNSAKRRSSCDIFAKPCANAKCSRKATNLVRRQSSLVGCTGGLRPLTLR